MHHRRLEKPMGGLQVCKSDENHWRLIFTQVFSSLGVQLKDLKRKCPCEVQAQTFGSDKRTGLIPIHET